MNSRRHTGENRATGRLRVWLRFVGAAQLLLLAACVPSANVLSTPSFKLDAANSGFISIDPPGVGDGAALFRLTLEVENANKTALQLTGLDGALLIRGARAAGATFRGAVNVPAGGTAPLLLDVKVPLGAAPALLDSLAAHVAGAATPFRLDAAVTVQALGAPLRYPQFTLVSGELQGNFSLAAPRLELLQADLRFEAVDSVALTLRLRLLNGGAIGVLAQLPHLQLGVAGAEAAVAALSPLALPSHGSNEAELTFRFAPASLGEALTAQIQAASAGVGGVAISLRGGWLLEAPGIATLTLPTTTLLEASVR